MMEERVAGEDPLWCAKLGGKLVLVAESVFAKRVAWQSPRHSCFHDAPDRS